MSARLYETYNGRLGRQGVDEERRLSKESSYASSMLRARDSFGTAQVDGDWLSSEQQQGIRGRAGLVDRYR